MLGNDFEQYMTKTEMINILISVYEAKEEDFGFSEMCEDELWNLLDSYKRGVQQKINACCKMYE